MKIGGFQPCSFSDFPGHLAAVVFTQGCNFRCPFCHNARLLPTEDVILSASAILHVLRARRRQLDGVVITGGEPTLQGDLSSFLAELRQLGLKIKLDTNGSRPEILQSLIEAGLLDYIAMDIKAPWKRYDQLAGLPVRVEHLRESMSLIVGSGIAHEFRTTVVTPLLAPADLRVIGSQIPKRSPYKTQPFRPEYAFAPALRQAPVPRAGS